MTSNTQRTQPRASPRSHRLRVWPALTAAVLLEAGCHILDVTNPDIVMPPSLNGSAALPTIRAGAIGDFAIGYSGSGAQGSGGNTEGQILLSGMLADELINTATFPNRILAEARQPLIVSATLHPVLRKLHRAGRRRPSAPPRSPSGGTASAWRASARRGPCWTKTASPRRTRP